MTVKVLYIAYSMQGFTTSRNIRQMRAMTYLHRIVLNKSGGPPVCAAVTVEVINTSFQMFFPTLQDNDSLTINCVGDLMSFLFYCIQMCGIENRYHG